MTVLQTFTLAETFGVNHPRQIIKFDMKLPVNVQATNVGGSVVLSMPGYNFWVKGPDGNPAVFQVMSNGQIAVNTDLAANTTRTWQLMSGIPPSTPTEPNPVQFKLVGDNYELTNGIMGVRIPGIPLANPGRLVQESDWVPKELVAAGPEFQNIATVAMS